MVAHQLQVWCRPVKVRQSESVNCHIIIIIIINVTWWWASDLQSRVHGFDSQPFCFHIVTGEVVHTRASVTKQYSFVLAPKGVYALWLGK